MSSQRNGIKLALGVTGLVAAGVAAGAYTLYKQANHHDSLASLLRGMTGKSPTSSTSSSTPTNKSAAAIPSAASGPPGGPNTVATAGRSGIETKHYDGELTADEVHRLLEILSSPPDAPSEPIKDTFTHLTTLSDQLNMRLGSMQIPGALSYHILSNLSLVCVSCMSGVNKSYNTYITALLHNRDYLRRCARPGFPDGKNGRVRGHCWRIVSGSGDIAARITTAAAAGVEGGGIVPGTSTQPGDPSSTSSTPSTTITKGEIKSYYQRLVERRSADEENVLKDVHRTLIHYGAFETEDEAHQVLARVLLAYAVHDPEVGYCQGMNFVAAFLLTKMSEEHAYWALYTVMTRPQYRLRLFYLPDLSGLLVAKHQFRSLFELHLPALYQHFTANDVYSDMHTEWFMTLFTATATPRETSARIWDLFLVEGYCVIHRVALAILYRSQDVLLTQDFEGIIHHLKMAERDPDLMNPDRLLYTADMFSSITPQLLARMERQFIRAKLTQHGLDL